MSDPIKISRGGKIEIKTLHKVSAKTLPLLYTPGVAEVVKEIIKNKENANDLTWKSKTVAIITDGSAILGLGNHGALPALPVMEAKAVLFKELGGVNAIPLVLDTQDPREIIKIVTAVATSFGGINLEDIAAPNCFLIEEALKKNLKIPVFHDDQHGTAVAVLAGLINASKVAGKNLKKCRIVISGAGAAGIAIAKLLIKFGCQEIILYDSKGAISSKRRDLNFAKKEIAKITNKNNFEKKISDALDGTDIFIGVSGPNLLSRKDIKKMNSKSIVFALANPVPEVLPTEAKKGGAYVIATGRSDFPNQINNALVFPGIFKGALQGKKNAITDNIKIKAAKAIANLVKKPSVCKIIPTVTDKRLPIAISRVF